MFLHHIQLSPKGLKLAMSAKRLGAYAPWRAEDMQPVHDMEVSVENPHEYIKLWEGTSADQKLVASWLGAKMNIDFKVFSFPTKPISSAEMIIMDIGYGTPGNAQLIHGTKL